MLILRHNTLKAEDLFIIETTMLKIADGPYHFSMDYSLLDKPKSEIFGITVGIFKRMKLCQTLGITTSEFLDFLIDIERGYHDNPYHSFYHAVDVTMMLYHMLEQYNMSEHLSSMDSTLLMIAALGHDIGHPGKNNSFEVSCKTKIAKQFKGLSVLESQSCVLTLELLEKHNLLRNVDNIEEANSCIVKMILATDMVCHFNLQNNVSALFEIVNSKSDKSQTLGVVSTNDNSSEKLQIKPLWEESELTPFSYFEQNYFKTMILDTNIGEKNTTSLSSQERLMMCKILIHAADISNPCRPWAVFQQLSLLVCVEFFRQGEEESKLGLPISPNMDSKKANPSTINVGFIDYIVQPYFEALSRLFPKCQPFLVNCANNRGEWLKLSTEEIQLESSPTERLFSQVTIAAGTVDIPDKYMSKSMEQSLSRSVSFQDSLAPPPPGWASPALGRPYYRRKSEDTAAISRKLRKTSQRSSISVSNSSSSLGRRSSEETYMNQLKMVSFFD